MPIDSHVDARARLVRATVSGRFSDVDMRDAIRVMADSVGSDSHYSVLSDHRAVEAALTPEQLEQLLGYLEQFGQPFHGGRWAVVVSQLASFGMMRMLAVRAERIPLTVGIFTDPASAETWLATPPDTPAPYAAPPASS